MMSTSNFFKNTTLFLLVTLFIFSAWVAKAGPQHQSHHYRSAEMALSLGDTDLASTELKLALQENPLDSKAHYLLGTLLAWQGMEDQAMIGFQRAIMADPTNPEALHNLGTLLLRRDQAVPAAKLLEEAVILAPDFIPPYNSLAKAYYLAGLPELAIATYEEVLRRDAGNVVASQNIALLLAAAAPSKTVEDLEKLPEHFKKREAEHEEAIKTMKEGKPPPKPGGDAGAKPGGNAGNGKLPPPPGPSIATLRILLRDMPYLKLEEHSGMLVLTGWTRGPRERNKLDKILAKWPKVLDLTGVDAGDPQRMLEVDTTMFVVIGQDSSSVGFNFLQQINLSYTYFSNSNPRDSDWKGLNAKALTGNLTNLPSYGGLFFASVDYDVNIANAVDERVAVLARPHLTTLNGTPAYFLAGGEFVFKVSGLETGTIKPYPFGTSITITPTLLRTPGEAGVPRVHLDIQAQRTSVLEFLAAQSSTDQIVFDKLLVNSQAVVDLGQTLILSGLNQRESRTSRSGVPVLKEVPLLKYLFSQTTTTDINTAIIILLTPRDPAFMDEQNRRNLSDYIQQRRDLIIAKQGTEEDMLKYQERYPDWQKIPPNRFSSHFFLVQNSELYRSVSRDDLIEEDLDIGLLGVQAKPRTSKKNTNKTKDNSEDNNND